MPNKEEPSFRELFTELTREVTTLFRQEVALAKSEVSKDIGNIKTGVASLGIGGVVILAGIIFLLQAAVIGLAKIMEPWLAALLVGGVVTMIGILIVLKGRSNLQMKHLIPKRTIESLRHDRQLAKEHM